jgi:hypothetical protein
MGKNNCKSLDLQTINIFTACIGPLKSVFVMCTYANIRTKYTYTHKHDTDTMEAHIYKHMWQNYWDIPTRAAVLFPAEIHVCKYVLPKFTTGAWKLSHIRQIFVQRALFGVSFVEVSTMHTYVYTFRELGAYGRCVCVYAYTCTYAHQWQETCVHADTTHMCTCLHKQKGFLNGYIIVTPVAVGMLIQYLWLIVVMHEGHWEWHTHCKQHFLLVGFKDVGLLNEVMYAVTPGTIW